MVEKLSIDQFSQETLQRNKSTKKNSITENYILDEILQCRGQNVKTPKTPNPPNAESKNEMTKLKSKVLIVCQKLNLQKNRQMLRIEI